MGLEAASVLAEARRIRPQLSLREVRDTFGSRYAKALSTIWGAWTAATAVVEIDVPSGRPASLDPPNERKMHGPVRSLNLPHFRKPGAVHWCRDQSSPNRAVIFATNGCATAPSATPSLPPDDYFCIWHEADIA